MKRILLLLLFGLGVFSAQSQITVDDTQTVQQLIENVLIIGNCAEVNNITSPNNSEVGGETWKSFGAFDGTTSSPAFPFAEGIILATNGVEMIPTGNPLQSGGFAWAGDADLEALIEQPGNTNNATAIEFEFIPFVEEISFNYLIASNEWPVFVCNYADTFAFILSGPGISDVNNYDHDANPNTPELSLDLGGQNIAVIPGTTIPVNPTNIHDLTANCFAGDLGEFAVPQLFDNASVNDGLTFYNARSIPLTATAQVIPGQTYNIKLVIADRQDTILDSAVFIESASFDLGGIDLGPDITIENGDAPCEGEIVTLDAGFSAANIQYFWAKDGNILPGENEQTLEVTENGEYEVGIQIGAGGTACFGVSNTVIIEFFPTPVVDIAGSPVLCQDETNTLDATPLNLNDLQTVSYTWSKDGNELAGENNPTLDITEEGLYEVLVLNNECEATAQFQVELVVYSLDLGEDENLCSGEGGPENITLMPNIEGLSSAQENQILYLWSDGSTEETLTVSESGTYTLETDVNGCIQTDEITVNIVETLDVVLADAVKCPEDEVVLNTGLSETSEEVTFSWTLNGVPIGDNNPSITADEEGTYVITVNNQGCESTATAVVSNYDVDNCVITQGISPNEDGFNDCMDLTWLNDQLGIDRLRVFNRYGRKVFEETNYEDTFCGQDDNGDELSTGTYFYVIDLANTDQRFERVVKGWVYINLEQ